MPLLSSEQLRELARKKLRGKKLPEVPAGASEEEIAQILRDHMVGWSEKEQRDFIFWWVMAK